MIKNIYLINLDKRPERLQSFIEESKKSKLLQNYQRISGIDGSTLSDEKIRSIVTSRGYNDLISGRPAKGLYLTRGAVGLALTYKRLIENCFDTSLLLEDDIKIDNNFDIILDEAIKELPKNWDILYLGWYKSKNLVVQNISKYINRLSGQINGTQGWIVNPNSIEKIIKLFPISYQIDTELYRSVTLEKYSTNYPLITRNNYFKSDIQV